MKFPPAENQSFQQLKGLLLGEQTRRLDEVETVAQRVDLYVGARSRLETATADILVDAFRKAQKTQHEELAGALAPAIVSGISCEIQNSRGRTVEALAPIAGDLVAAAAAGVCCGLAGAVRRRLGALVLLFAAAATMLTISGGLDPLRRMLLDLRINSAFAVALTAHPGLAEYPTRLFIDHKAARVVMRGLAVDESEAQAVLEEIAPAALPYRIERDLKLVVLESENQRVVAKLQAALAETKAAVEALRAQAGGAGAPAERRSSTSRAE